MKKYVLSLDTHDSTTFPLLSFISKWAPGNSFPVVTSILLNSTLISNNLYVKSNFFSKVTSLGVAENNNLCLANVSPLYVYVPP